MADREVRAVIFQPDFAALVVAGQKTQTRRRPKGKDPCRYVVGRTYAVQDGRGRRALARIRVVSVALTPVWHLSAEDAAAEGFESPAGFWEWWTNRYGDISDQWCWRIEFELA
jgi:hypothetical protein